MAAFDESDCCGNGCANCVLDVKPFRDETSDFTKINILNNYANFTLRSKTHFEDLPDILELHFKYSLSSTEEKAFILNVPSGQHLMMRAPVNDGNGKRLLRPYSPFWVDKNKLEFNLSIDDEVEFRGPIGGRYARCANDSLQNLVLISQGVAIAPMLPIVNEILANEDDMTRIYQFACFSDLKHAYFRKDLKEFNKFWNYTSFIYLSRQICENIECLNNKSCVSNCNDLARKLLYKEKVYAKRLNGMELLNAAGEKTLNSAMFVVSGSRIFQEQVSNELKNLGLNICDENLFLL